MSGNVGQCAAIMQAGRGGEYGEMQRAKEVKRKLVNDNYRSCNHSPSGVRATIVQKRGKATSVVH
jgi:hypothetical protein